VRASNSTTVASTRGRQCALAHQIAARALADRRQHFREGEHAVVLGRVALGGPIGVIAILLSSRGVAAGGLQMRARVNRDPHVGPRRRQHQRADPRERLAIANLRPRASST
jgi:hypothetical protein